METDINYSYDNFIKNCITSLAKNKHENIILAHFIVMEKVL